MLTEKSGERGRGGETMARVLGLKEGEREGKETSPSGIMSARCSFRHSAKTRKHLDNETRNHLIHSKWSFCQIQDVG